MGDDDKTSEIAALKRIGVELEQTNEYLKYISYAAIFFTLIVILLFFFLVMVVASVVDVNTA